MKLSFLLYLWKSIRRLKKIVALLYICILYICILYINQFCSLSLSYAFEPTKTLDVRGKNIFWENQWSGCTNNIRVVNFGDNKKYFKECKRKLDVNSEVQRIINDYFHEYLDGNFSNDKELISNILCDKENLKKFAKIGFLFESQSNLWKFIRDEISADFLGISLNTVKNLKIDLKNFLIYSSKELFARERSFGVDQGEFQANLAKKQIATYKLAKYLCIENVIARSKFVKLLTDKGEKIGIITDEAIGKNDSEIRDMKVEINPEFQLDLTNLQILDTITHEQDHFLKNCRIKINNNKIIGIVAFDNEDGFWSNGDSYWNIRGLLHEEVLPLITKDNKINLPHMSRSLAERILNTEDRYIDNILNCILSEKQVYAVKDRFRSLKSAISNTIKNDEGFLLSNNQWSRETIEKELSGNYGSTYLSHFCKSLNIT